MVSATANSLVRVLLDPRCAACGERLVRPLSSPVCETCWTSIAALTPPWCTRCGNSIAPGSDPPALCPRCLEAPLRITHTRSVGRYEGSLRQIVHAFKYDRRRVLAAPLARLMKHAGGELLDDAAAVVPVPLHAWRSLRRGFNQADDLASALGVPVWRVLSRKQHGPPQAGLPASRRHANVRDAFAMSLGMRLGVRRGRARALRHATVVLIDDVMTTGATLDACAAVLLESGVRNVRALTIARTVAAPRSPPPRQPDLSTARRR